MRTFAYFATTIALVLAGGALARAPTPRPETVVVDLTAPGRDIVPDEALGAGLDGMGRGEMEPLYTPFNIARMRSADLRPVTYRLRTELGVEAWHWGPEGTWSDPARSQGYWVSSDNPVAPILTSFGYDLPRRGDTVDNANNAGFSRLDDGDAATFWKSNPYLDPRYTGEARAQPQWAVVQLDKVEAIDAARISWAAPYAVSYRLQYWVGRDEYDPAGRWIDFPTGLVTDGDGGEALLRLAPSPVRTAFVRLLMTQGSGTTDDPASKDERDRLGYAVREIQLGVIGADGVLSDVIRHGRGRDDQTVTYVSSTDPWHRAADKDEDLQQPGFDRLFTSGVTNGLPVMVPAPVLFDTPENAAAEVRFLERRGYRIGRLELGEEPDGQYIDAETYGALYIEAARAVHAVDPKLVTGGPSLQNGVADSWLDPNPDRSWTSHLIHYLKARDALGDLGFFSFERYPFDDMCGDMQTLLLEQTRGMARTYARLKRDGVPTTIPWIITEYGFSAYSGQPMVELPSALLNADIVGQFLTLGGAGAHLFGYGPNTPVNQHLACAGYGNMMLFQADADGQAAWPMPAYYGARLMTQVWAQPGDKPNRIFPARLVRTPTRGEPLINAYALHRPDGRFAVMLVNRDAAAAHAVQIRFKGARETRFQGAAEIQQYSSKQYRWLADGAAGHPTLDLPPARRRVPDGARPFVLPPFSLTVVRGVLAR